MRTKLFTSPLYRFFNRVADLICVSLLTLLFSIPVITFFAAITAAHNVIQDMIFDTEPTIFRKFWQAFRTNFKQATAAGIIVLAVSFIALCNFYWFPGQFSGMLSTALSIVFGVLLYFILTLSVCIFPLIARYHNPIAQHLKNAVILCFYALPRAFLVTAINILPLLLSIFNPAFLIYTLAFWTFLGPGTTVYLTDLLLRPIFLRIEARNHNHM